MKVQLEWSEVMAAAVVGVVRRITSLKRGLPDKYGYDSKIDGWQVDIEGACGELAVAKALGLYWPATVNTFKQNDVFRFQVRTASQPTYKLIIREGDEESGVFVLVTGNAPSYEVRGWIRGSEARRSNWLRDPCGRPPAWFVPQSALHSIEDLK